MKRAYVLAAVALVVVAGFFGQRVLSNDDEPSPSDASPSRSFNADEMDAQGKLQAEQLAAAMEELERDTEAFANPHTFVVTVRDELPLNVWDDNCHMTASAPPTLGVFRKDYTPISGPVALPSKAKQLPGGGCVATVEVRVPDFPAYNVSLIVEGRGISDDNEQPAIKREGKSQRVTIVE